MRTAICLSTLTWAWFPVMCMAHPAAEQAAGNLQSADPAVREHAASTLGRIGDRSTVPALVDALKDPASGVRREAAKALGSIKDARAVAPLAQALGDRDMNVRLYAAYALGEIKDATAVGPLLHALRDPEWCVRDQAAWALREIRDPAVAAPVAAALKEPNVDVAHVVWILRHLRSAQTVEQLAALAAAPDAETRIRVVRVLGELQDAAAVDPLIAALEDGDPGVRRRAVEALAKIGDDRAGPSLEKLAAREQDPAVLEAVKGALFQMSREGDLVAYWSFDDRSTRVAKDLTGRGNDGRILGPTPVEGKVGYALQFGKGKYVELGKPPALPIREKPLTVMAWVNSDAPNGVVVARGGAFCGFSLYVKDGVARFGIHRRQEDPAHIAAGAQTVVGSWVHLAGVVKQDCIELYVNGRLAATASTKGYIPSDCGQGMEIGYDTANSPAEITDNFQGIIDEVKVYHAALSEDEIAKQCH